MQQMLGIWEPGPVSKDEHCSMLTALQPQQVITVSTLPTTAHPNYTMKTRASLHRPSSLHPPRGLAQITTGGHRCAIGPVMSKDIMHICTELLPSAAWCLAHTSSSRRAALAGRGAHMKRVTLRFGACCASAAHTSCSQTENIPHLCTPLSNAWHSLPCLRPIPLMH